MAIGPKLPRPFLTLPGRASSAPQQPRQLSGGTADPQVNAVGGLYLTQKGHAAPGTRLRVIHCGVVDEIARCPRASRMKRVAVFGNAGGGKSTIARRLAELTGLPLYVVDMMQFKAGGVKVPRHEFLQAHAGLLRREEWIIDGFGSEALSWERFVAADTLVYVDLPLLLHYAWVTKRLIKGLFANPKGWPEGSPLWSSTLGSYRVIRLCHHNLTPKYRLLAAEAVASKRVHHLRSVAQIHSFLEAVRNELRTKT